MLLKRRSKTRPRIACETDFAIDGLLRASALNKIRENCPHISGWGCSLLMHPLENGYAVRWHCSACQKKALGL